MPNNNNTEVNEATGTHRQFVERRSGDNNFKVIDTSLGTILGRVMEINGLLVELKGEVGVIKTELDSHLTESNAEKLHYIETLNQLLEKIKELDKESEKMQEAFVGEDGKKDYLGHREYHNTEIKDHVSWEKLKQSAKTKVTEHLITFLLMILGLGFFTWFNQNISNSSKVEQQVDTLSAIIKNQVDERAKQQKIDTAKKRDNREQ